MEPEVHREKPYEEASRGSGVSESYCRAGGISKGREGWETKLSQERPLGLH